MDEWKIRPPYQLQGTSYTIVGYSVAAEKTSFFIPELKIMFDCGVPHSFQPEHIFVSHLHLDHSMCMPHTVVQLGNFKSKIDKKPAIHVPKIMVEKTADFMHTIFRMSKNNNKHKVGEKYEIVGVVANDIFEMDIKKKRYM